MLEGIKYFCYKEIDKENFNGAVKSVQFALLNNLRRLKYNVEVVDSKVSCLSFFRHILSLKRYENVIFTYEHIPLFSVTSYFIDVLGKMGYFLLGKIKKLKNIKIIVHVLDIPLKQIEELNIEKLLYRNKMISKEFLKNYQRSFLNIADVIITYSEAFTKEIKKIVPNTEIIQLPILPNIEMPCNEEISKEVELFINRNKVNIFYTGELSRAYEKNKISEILKYMRKQHGSGIVICGNNGEWIKNTSNILYLGNINMGIHNKIAKKCDFGIMIYPNNSYYKITPTTKFSNYIINNLPILAIYSETISKNIDEFKVGESLEEKDFSKGLEKWILNKEERIKYMKNVEELKEKLTNTYFEKIWTEKIWTS